MLYTNELWCLNIRIRLYKFLRQARPMPPVQEELAYSWDHSTSCCHRLNNSKCRSCCYITDPWLNGSSDATSNNPSLRKTKEFVMTDAAPVKAAPILAPIPVSVRIWVLSEIFITSYELMQYYFIFLQSIFSMLFHTFFSMLSKFLNDNCKYKYH